jgi:hypothetical protein
MKYRATLVSINNKWVVMVWSRTVGNFIPLCIGDGEIEPNNKRLRAIEVTRIYRVNGDTPELIAESNMQPEQAITEHRNANSVDSQIIHMGGSVYTYVTGEALFYARRVKA